VKCRKENHGIQIQSAEFGKASRIMCQGDEYSHGEKSENNTGICRAKDVKEIIRPFCDGKQKCDSFIVNTANLGEPEGCRNVRKALRIYIECGKFIFYKYDCQHIQLELAIRNLIGIRISNFLHQELEF
jgi:hypothetical protein